MIVKSLFSLLVSLRLLPRSKPPQLAEAREVVETNNAVADLRVVVVDVAADAEDVLLDP